MANATAAAPSTQAGDNRDNLVPRPAGSGDEIAMETFRMKYEVFGSEHAHSQNSFESHAQSPGRKNSYSIILTMTSIINECSEG